MSNIQSITQEIKALQEQITNTPANVLTAKYMLGSKLGEARKAFQSDKEFGAFLKQESVKLSQKTVYNLRQLPAFGTQEDCELVGYANVYKITAKGCESIATTVRTMLDKGYNKPEIRGYIKQEFKPSTLPLVNHSEELEQRIQWLEESLRDTMCGNEAGTEVVGKLLNELEEQDEIIAALHKEVAELKAQATTPTEEEAYGVPQEIVEEMLEEEEEPEMFEFHEIEYEPEVKEEVAQKRYAVPEITESEYSKAKTLVRMGIGREEDREIVREYEEVHHIGSCSSSMRARLAALKAAQSNSSSNKMYTASSDDDNEYGEWNE